MMTHALINALSQISMDGSAVMMDDTIVTIDDISVINVVGKEICVLLAVGLQKKAVSASLHKSDHPTGFYSISHSEHTSISRYKSHTPFHPLPSPG